MKIVNIDEKEDGSAILSIDLTDEDEELFYTIGKKNNPELTDRTEIIQKAMLDAISEDIKNKT